MTIALLNKLLNWQGEAISHAMIAARPDQCMADKPAFLREVQATVIRITSSVIGNREGDSEFDQAIFKAVLEATCIECLRICGRPGVEGL